MEKRITIGWAVTGFHKFHVTPAKNEPLTFQREPNNPFDKWAILVKRKTGEVVGRVPANLCRLLIKLKQEKVITGLKCVCTGVVERSEKPHYMTTFKHGEDMDRNGGGVIVGADYLIKCPIEQYDKFKAMVESNIPRSDLCRFAV